MVYTHNGPRHRTLRRRGMRPPSGTQLRRPARLRDDSRRTLPQGRRDGSRRLRCAPPLSFHTFRTGDGPAASSRRKHTALADAFLRRGTGDSHQRPDMDGKLRRDAPAHRGQDAFGVPMHQSEDRSHRLRQGAGTARAYPEAFLSRTNRTAGGRQRSVLAV